jgi:type IV secretion system protein VirB9
MNRFPFPLAISASLALSAAAPPPTFPSPPEPSSGTKISLSRRPHHRRPAHRPSPVLRDVAAANRSATLEPEPQAFVDAVQIFPYAEGTLFHVYTAPGRITDIALQPGEQLGAVASGDTVRWVIGDTSSGAGEGKRTHVLIKPFTAGLATSVVITTDRRVYHIALTSTSGAAMAALSWTYPQDALIAIRKAADKAEAAAPVATGLDVAQLHFGYAVTGDTPDWRPLRAFDDGRQTFIEFPPSIATGDAPPLFIVGAKGAAELVNYRMRGRYYVVDRLFDVAELRFGLKHQQVVRITRTGDAQSSRGRV